MLKCKKANCLIVSVITLLLTAVLLTACGSSSTTTTTPAAKAPANRLEAILAAGELVVATSPDFAPMEFIDIRKSGQDQYVGLDPWFAKYIADELGVTLRIEAMDFSALQAGVSMGQVDMALSGFAWTESRAESMELSDFYNNTRDLGQGILVLKAEADNYQTAEDFAGKVVAVQNASLQYNLLVSQVPDAIPEIVGNINDGVMMLITGKVDAVGVSGSNGEMIGLNYSEVTMSGFYYEYDSEGNVIGMPKGEVELCNRVNEIIAKAHEADLFNKWMDEAEALAKEIGWEN